MKACIASDGSGKVTPRAGVMAVALVSGPVAPGDNILVVLPKGKHVRLSAI